MRCCHSFVLTVKQAQEPIIFPGISIPRLYPKVPRIIFMGASLDIELAQSGVTGLQGRHVR